uniref:Uncharacterized protein n=1 Tax=viral metagenome TaxID=1070528 RepID=A0A6C0ELX2_9ZZZZ
MINITAYGILIFYGLLAIIGAAIGSHFDKTNGFSNGYIAGTALSLVLWFTVGRKMAGV